MTSNWQDFVEIDERFYRPAEVDYLLGDYSKAERELGWTPKTDVASLARMMVESDLELAKRERNHRNIDELEARIVLNGRNFSLPGRPGFVGRHVIAAGRDRYAILATGRGTRPAWLPDDVAWHQVNLLDRASVATLPRDLPHILHLASETVPARFTSYEPLAESVEMTLNLCRHLTIGGGWCSPAPAWCTEPALTHLSKTIPWILAAITVWPRRLEKRSFAARPAWTPSSRGRSTISVRDATRSCHSSIIRRVRTAVDGEPIQMHGLDSIRDFLDVSDIIAAYFALLEAPSLPFSAFNVASGQPTSISDVVRATARILHKPIGEVLFSAQGNSADDTSVVVGDAQRLHAVTGWEPRVSLEESLRRLAVSTA